MAQREIDLLMAKFSHHIDLSEFRSISDKITSDMVGITRKISQEDFNKKYAILKNSIPSLEDCWDKKPIDFLQRNHVQRYVDETIDVLEFIITHKEKLFESYLVRVEDTWVNNQVGFLFLIRNTLIPYIMICIILSPIAGVIGIIVSAVLAVLFFFYRIRGLHKKFKKLPLSQLPQDYQNDLTAIDRKIDNLKNRIDLSKNEMFANADFNQSLLNQIKSRQVNAHFNEQESKQLLLDRMEIMKLEIEKAREMAKDMTEQHRITEEMRIKYAREMMELEQQLKAQSDRDLYEKMEILKKMMGG